MISITLVLFLFLANFKNAIVRCISSWSYKSTLYGKVKGINAILQTARVKIVYFGIIIK